MIHEQKVIVIDLDGTVAAAKREGESYAEVEPNAAIVAQLRAYRSRGYYIIIQSSRNMRTHDGNVGRINADTLRTILAWLDAHDIPHDEVHVGKPWCGHDGFYVDDRAIRPSEFLTKTHEEILDLLAHEGTTV